MVMGYFHYWLCGTKEIVECTTSYRDEVECFQHERFEIVGPAHYHDQFIVFTSTENADCLVIDLGSSLAVLSVKSCSIRFSHRSSLSWRLTWRRFCNLSPPTTGKGVFGIAHVTILFRTSSLRWMGTESATTGRLISQPKTHSDDTTSAVSGGSRMLQLLPARRSIAAPIHSNRASMQSYSFFL